MADPPAPGSPLWYLEHLSKALAERTKQTKTFDDYYEGIHPLLFATEKFKEAFGGLFSEFADNWCDLVVDAVEERLNIEGFRWGDELKADDQVWQYWQANDLDAGSQLAHVEALVNGSASAIVWTAEDNTPRITVEHPSQVIVAYASGARCNRVAALKQWLDEATGRLFATVYLPDGLYKFQSSKPLDLSALSGYVAEDVRWDQRNVAGETWPLPNPLGEVPVVELENRPRMLKPGRSELAKVIPLQNAVNKIVGDMIVASEFGAFRQRWVTGMDIPVDPNTQQPIEPFKSAVDRLWVAEPVELDDGSGKAIIPQFGEFSQTDLSIFVRAVEMLVQHIASQTRTPPHYFYLSGQFPSGESIKSAETGLVAKTKRKMRFFGEAWEDVMRLALLVAGEEEKAAYTGAETIWGDPESRTEGEHVDALLKLKSIGVPDEVLWEKAGFSPTEIARIKAIRTSEQLLAPDAQPVAAAPPPAGA